MMRRDLLGLVAALLTAAVPAGCGGGGGQPESPPANTSPTAGEDAVKQMQGMTGSPAPAPAAKK